MVTRSVRQDELQKLQSKEDKKLSKQYKDLRKKARVAKSKPLNREVSELDADGYNHGEGAPARLGIVEREYIMLRAGTQQIKSADRDGFSRDKSGPWPRRRGR